MTASGAAKRVQLPDKAGPGPDHLHHEPTVESDRGPWQLQSYGGASSPDIFVPNPTYSGPKPKTSEFEGIPFTTDRAEFTSKGRACQLRDDPDPDIPAPPRSSRRATTSPPSPTGALTSYPEPRKPCGRAHPEPALYSTGACPSIDQNTRSSISWTATGPGVRAGAGLPLGKPVRTARTRKPTPTPSRSRRPKVPEGARLAGEPGRGGHLSESWAGRCGAGIPGRKALDQPALVDRAASRAGEHRPLPVRRRKSRGPDQPEVAASTP